MEHCMFYLYVGTGKFKERFEASHVSPSRASVEKYVNSNIVSKSVFADLLLKTVNDGGVEKVCWDLQLLVGVKGDEIAAKNGNHPQSKQITSDSMLEDIAKEHRSIHLQIVFDEAKFAEWEQEQQHHREIPMAKIVGCREDSKYLRIDVNYPKKALYQACYKVYQTGKVQSSKNNEWNEIADGSNEVLLSNLWQFKDYTIEIALKNKYSNVYGKPQCKSGFKITSRKIMFDGDLKDSELDATQKFECRDHKSFYKWCKKELQSNNLFDDLQQMKYGKIMTEWILSMIEGFDDLNGQTFFCKDVSNEHIIENLLKTSKGKNYKNKHTNDENKDAFSRDLCVSVLSRLRILAFEQEAELGFIPSNDYVKYFWCFFNAKPDTDIYVRCCEG